MRHPRQLPPTALAGLVAGAALSAFAGGAAAQKMSLRVADSLPATHEVVTHGIKFFMEQVTKRTNGDVTFEYFGAEQLGKARDLLNLTVAGAVDIGYVAPSLVPEKMPLAEVSFLPGLYRSACEGTRAYWPLLKTGVLAQTELKQNNVHILFAALQPPNALFLSQADPRNLKTLSGIKVRSSGAAQDLTIKALGAVPIRMSGPEMYESLQRKTIEGMIVSYQAMLAYGWVDVTKYATSDVSYGGFTFTFLMAEPKWRALPERVRQVMSQVGDETNLSICKHMDTQVAGTIEKLRQKGMTVAPLPGPVLEAHNAALGTVATQWAQNLDKQRKPATQTLNEFQAELKKLR